MSSHTTVNATALVLPGTPSGSTETFGKTCWPSVLALARPEASTVPVGETTRYGTL
jgi:hypothetical protein